MQPNPQGSCRADAPSSTEENQNRSPKTTVTKETYPHRNMEHQNTVGYREVCTDSERNATIPSYSTWLV